MVDTAQRSQDYDKTRLEPVATSAVPLEPQRDLSKTHIVTEETSQDEKGNEVAVLRNRRKIIGWLVSYTIDPLGRDYRLYEGRNNLGSSKDNDIILNTDASISGHHCIILFRNNTLYIKDNLSTNGTKVNGKDIEPETSEVFTDGTSITLGDTVFLFKSSL